MSCWKKWGAVLVLLLVASAPLLPFSPTVSAAPVVSLDGWGWDNPLPQGHDLYAVWSNSSSDVFATGYHGTILHYDGSSWSSMSPGTTQNLYGVWGSSPTDVFAVGSAGTVLRFNGTSWSQMSSGTSNILYSTWGSPSGDVFAVGDSGTILHFDGDSWADMTNATATTNKLRGVWGSSATDVFAVGDSGDVVRYDGNCWSPMTSGTSQDLYGIWGSAANDVFAVGDSGVMRHFNGTSWTSVSSGMNRDAYAIWGSGPGDIYATGKEGRVAHYNGTSWALMDSGTSKGLRGICGSGASDVLAVGEFGTVIHCDGTSWTSLSSGSTTDLKSTWGISASDVFAVGDTGTVLHCDGGAWVSMYGNTTSNLGGVWGSSSSNVYAVGDSGTVVHYDGVSWAPLGNVTANDLHAVWGSSASDIYAVGDSGTIVRYDGNSWASVDSGTSENLNAIWGSAANNVYAVGEAGTILHYDGDSWEPASSPTTKDLRSIWGSSSSGVFAVGDWGTIAHWNGASWSTMSSGTIDRLSAVFGSSSSDAFAVGDWGTILHYNGTSWSPTSSGTTRSFGGVWGSTAFDYFAVGDYGTVLHYPEPAPPTVDTVTPSQSLQGDTLDVTVGGANFSSATDIDFGLGITVNLPFSIDSPSQITANVTIQDAATLGARDVSVTTPEGTGTLTDGFTVLNRPPNQPSNVSPLDEAVDQSLTPTLESSAFSDDDPADGHAASQWQITTVAGDYGSPARVYDSGPDASNKTQIVVPAGELDGNTTHYWHVRHQDNRGDWSDWSTETSFATTNRPPDAPTNTSPSNGAADVSVTPTLQSSAFSDPDSDGTHAASQWQITTVAGDYTSPERVYDSGPDASNKTQIVVPEGSLGGHTTYYWHVRHQDNHDEWSEWSVETSFTTANLPPNQPGNTSPSDGATGVSLTPALISSGFLDPDEGDTHAASQWQVRTNWGSYSSPLFDSGIDDTNLTQLILPADLLNTNRTYYWRVKHQDNHEGWSDWSAETSFTTLNRAPDQPSNTSPADGDTSVSLTPTLKSSSFSDPDAGDTHVLSQWQVRTTAGDYDSPVYDSGDSPSLIQITLPAETLYYNSTYYWRVRHQDSHDTWSDWSTETSFTTLNRVPDAPENVSPVDEGVDVEVTPFLQCSEFSDPDAGDTHAASRWQVSTIPGYYSSPGLKYDSDTDISNLTNITLPSGTLDGNTTYYWRVKHQDNHEAWSDWSAETSFTTQNRAPEAPANVLPTDSATDVSVIPTLECSVLSDPDGDGDHAASQWQITTASGDYSSPVFDSGADTSNLTQITTPAGTLDGNTSYYWRVRHQDDHGGWSAWSAETSFTTENRPPEAPTTVSPAEGATDVSVAPTLESSAFFDPDGDRSHSASQWQITTASGDYCVPELKHDFTSGSPNLIQTVVPAGTLDGNTTYYWRVKHEDNHGAWSEWSAETSFTTMNRAPDAPSNVLPAEGANNVDVMPTLESSVFSDPDGDGSHSASQWQITTASGDYSSPGLKYDSGTNISNLTNVTTPAGTLDGNTTYYWRVKHQDNHDEWSGWSQETSFTTANRPPAQPANTSPDDGTIVNLSPTLECSAFYDPDGDGSHAASQWQVTSELGNYDTPALVYDSGTDGSNLTGITVPSTPWDPLCHNTTYYWRVKHQDNHGEWSPWSEETSFTTPNRMPDAPVNISPADESLIASLTPTLQSEEFSDPDEPVGDTHAASRWQISTISGEYTGSALIYEKTLRDPANLTSITVPSGVLDGNTTYYWHVQHQDNHGAWSDWSNDTSFTTPSLPPNRPQNVSPMDGATDAGIPPSLQSSAFSDPDEGDSHAASQWQITTSSGDYSSPLFDSGPIDQNLTQIAPPEEQLNGNTTYYWHVRHQDSHGAWSDWSVETSFTTRDREPAQPTNLSPVNRAWSVSLTPSLLCSDFSDPDIGDSHQASQWQITTTSGDYSSPTFDSATDTTNLSQITIPSGTLYYNTTYHWRVRHQDSYNGWSDWSAQTAFTTLNRAPQQPANAAPTDGATGVSLTPTLRSSDFSDLDEGDTHSATQWQVSTVSGDYSSPILDTGADSASLTQVAVPSGTLYYNTTYCWRVRHQDNHNDWSDWSGETSFTTLNRAPHRPVCASPADGATGVGLTPTLECSAFSDPDNGDTHAASQWQITTGQGNYSSPVWDSGTATPPATSISVPPATLSYSTCYYWRVRHHDNHGDWSAYSEERSFTTRNTPAGSSVVLALLSDMLEITFDTVSGDGHTTATTLEQASPGSGPIPPEFRAIGGTFVEMSTTADHTGPVVLRLGYAQFQSDVTKESGLKVFHWNGTAWQDVTTSLDTLNDVVSAEVPALSTVFIGNPWREAETPAGTDVTITPGDLIMTFHSVTTSGTTTVSTSGVNPASPIDDSLSCVGRVFVDISTAATYSGPVTVGVRYTELDVVRDESDLRLYHWNGTEWEDITTRVDTDNNVVYGEVANLSSFFIGEVVTGDSPMSVSILIGIAIVLAVGAVVYFASRRFVGKRA